MFEREMSRRTVVQGQTSGKMWPQENVHICIYVYVSMKNMVYVYFQQRCETG